MKIKKLLKIMKNLKIMNNFFLLNSNSSELAKAESDDMKNRLEAKFEILGEEWKMLKFRSKNEHR